MGKLYLDLNFVEWAKKNYKVVEDISLFADYDYDNEEDIHICWLKLPYLYNGNDTPCFTFTSIKEFNEKILDNRILDYEDIEYLGEELNNYKELSLLTISYAREVAKRLLKDFLENNKEIEWNLEKLIDASRQGDCILYEEMIEQLRFNNVDKHIQDLQTLIAISWSVSEYESTQSTTLNEQLYNLYYNLNLKENTLIEILGEDTYNKLYEEA